ncbi:Uncharacterised protein [Mycobacteroides abscessus subsp. abscessus]|nr:Uncharacterised protein [Mycobacteroides abscessus subsp. abscessus]
MRVPVGALRFAWFVVDLAHLIHVDERVEDCGWNAREGPDHGESLALVSAGTTGQ